MWLSVLWRFFSFPVCVQHRKLPPPLPSPSPTTANVKLASDWLGVGLELRSFCYWTPTQTGNLRIDKWLLSKYGRVQSAPLTSSEASLISIMSSVYRGPIRPLAVGWAASQGPWGKGLIINPVDLAVSKNYNDQSGWLAKPWASPIKQTC